jgi:Xaa-Pro aminopeptidase
MEKSADPLRMPPAARRSWRAFKDPKMNPSRICLASCLLFLALVARLEAQSDVAFPKEVYAARRARLAAQTGDALVIVPGRYSIGDEDLFKQDPNFWYLTGVESPYAILVIVPGTPAANSHPAPSVGADFQSALTGDRSPSPVTAPRAVLFLPEKYQFASSQFPMADERFRRAVWNRPVRRLAPGKDAAEATGIAETFPIDEFAARVTELAAGRAVVYLPLDAMNLYAPPGFAPPRTLPQQFASVIAGLLPGLEQKNLTALLAPMRMVKDAYEIAALRRAAEISADGLVAAMKAARPGMNDREIAGLMEYVWKREGSARASFPPIVASGASAMTFFTLRGENYNSTDHVMRDGDLLFVDYGAAEFDTYTSDLCRTFPVSGKFTPEQRKYYDIVLEAQEAAIAAVKPGVMMVDIIKAAAAVYRKHGLEPYEDIAKMGEDKVWGLMPSPTHYLERNAGLVRYTRMGVGVRDLGHPIGLEATELRDYERPLALGTIITIEPKIYIPEKTIAIMIEDEVLVTADGHEVLATRAPKKADDIERLMQASKPAP